MPTLETPPNAVDTTGVPPPPKPESSAPARQESAASVPERAEAKPKPEAPLRPEPVRVRAGRFGELDHSELVHLLDSLDDERSKARFRESIYISLFFWIAVVLFLIFAPRIFPRRPEFVMPSGLHRDDQATNLTIPPAVRRAMEHAPRFKSAPRGPATPQPTAPQAPSPQEAQQPPAAANPAPQQAAPPPVVQQSQLPQPTAQQQAPLPSAPAPSAAPPRPSFGNPNTSARDMIQQATRPPGGGGFGDEGIPRAPGVNHGMGAAPQILSDTQGVDFNPYLNKIMREIYETWLPLIPEEARPPLNKQGETQIRFIINPDGTIGGMALEDSTHDDAINHACWGSITGVNQFPPLPKQFHGPNLELRIRYFTNREPK
jgi:outer membrane biosynthesis protein TonB